MHERISAEPRRLHKSLTVLRLGHGAKKMLMPVAATVIDLTHDTKTHGARPPRAPCAVACNCCADHARVVKKMRIARFTNDVAM
jgi:hypothetical protein